MGQIHKLHEESQVDQTNYHSIPQNGKETNSSRTTTLWLFSLNWTLWGKDTFIYQIEWWKGQ
jgi:hypothetical protein